MLLTHKIKLNFHSAANYQLQQNFFNLQIHNKNHSTESFHKYRSEMKLFSLKKTNEILSLFALSTSQLLVDKVKNFRKHFFYLFTVIDV
jgi:hypothetical protein